MLVAEHLASSSGVWRSAAPASERGLGELADAVSFRLPDTYLELLRVSDGGEGELAVPPYWLCLWPSHDVVRYNAEYEVPRYAAGIFAFGQSGGGELLAFDLRGGPPYPVVAVPCIGMSLKQISAVAEDFDAFVRCLGCEPAV